MPDDGGVEHLYAHRDDPDEWGDPVVRKARGASRPAVVSVRFSPEELELLREAVPDGNLSGFIRASALRMASDISTMPQFALGTSTLQIQVVAASGMVVLPESRGSQPSPASRR